MVDIVVHTDPSMESLKNNELLMILAVRSVLI